MRFARAEGIVPAPESNHAIRVAIDEALAAKDEGSRGHPVQPVAATATSTSRRTRRYLSGKLEDYEYEPTRPARASWRRLG